MGLPRAPRRTKIVATLGPSTDPPGTVEALIRAGMDVARINCSHGDHHALLARAAQVREAARRCDRIIGLLFDLQGPKLRLSDSTPSRALVVGEVLTLGGRGTADVRVDFPSFASLVAPTSELVIGDGVPRLGVEEVRGDVVRARVTSSGCIGARKGIAITQARPDLPALTEKDLGDIAVAAELEADFVALSFVRSADDLEHLRRELRRRGCTARTIAKIEKLEAYGALDDILGSADAVMVARGDYGVEAGAASVPLMQKDTIARATRAGRAVITATQMLETMIEASEPTRAEASDVVNAVIDGTSAVMLSAETSVGAHPVEAVAAMAELASAGEAAQEIHGRARGPSRRSTHTAVLNAAVDLVDGLDAAALVIPTETGGAARECARRRPRQPIFALTSLPRVARQLTLEWGVVPLMRPDAASVDELIDASLAIMRDEVGLPLGSEVVLTAGRTAGTPGATNLLMVRAIDGPVTREILSPLTAQTFA